MKIQGKHLVRQATGYDYSPLEGYSFIPRHAGTQQSVNALARQYRANRIPFRVRYDGAAASIEAEHQMPEGGEVETPAGNWALIGQDETVDWRQHISFLSLPTDEQWNINKVIKGDFTVGYDQFIWYRDDGLDTPYEPSGATAENADFLLKLALKNQTSFTRTNWSLRHSMTVSQMWAVRLSGSNINKVYSKAALLAECAQFDDLLPPMHIAEINAIPATASIPSGYNEGWLKRTPSIQTVAGGRVECSVEYVLEIWPTIFYPLAT